MLKFFRSFEPGSRARNCSKLRLRQLQIHRAYSNLVEPFTYDESLLSQEASEPLVDHLVKRGLVSEITHKEELSKAIQRNEVAAYCGADPTAASLHLGNLVPLIVMIHYAIRGHKIIGIVGGATVRVGDPSGRTTERTPLKLKSQLDNSEKIGAQLSNFLQSGREFAHKIKYPVKEGEILVKNNFEWWQNMNLLHFLSYYGPHIRVNAMLARDSVKARLESENGIGFNEFSYQLLQAVDFWHLHKTHGINMQIGGNDQWGNITAGIDLIGRLNKAEQQKQQNPQKQQTSAFGLTVPLLTTSTGAKFGKSAGNALFVDPTLTPIFQMYNYFVQTPDADVAKLLKIFTLMPLQQIDEVVAKHMQQPELRYGQRVLAYETVRLIHGDEKASEASKIAAILFENHTESISGAEMARIFKNSNMLTEMKRSDVVGQSYVSLVSTLGDMSRSSAKQLLKSGGVYAGLQRQKIKFDETVQEEHLVDGTVLLMRLGKSKYKIVACR